MYNYNREICRHRKLCGVFFYGNGVIALLNVKQEAFCLHYAKTGNATESYKKAGYNPTSDNSAGAMARRLLQNVKIKARLEELAAELASEKIASVREVQERLTAILRGEIQEEQVVVEGCGDGVSEATIIKRQPQLKDMIKAGETLAKMQGGFDNSMNVTVTVPVFSGDEGLKD